jgi:hypothetical protein
VRTTHLLPVALLTLIGPLGCADSFYINAPIIKRDPSDQPPAPLPTTWDNNAPDPSATPQQVCGIVRNRALSRIGTHETGGFILGAIGLIGGGAATAMAAQSGQSAGYYAGFGSLIGAGALVAALGAYWLTKAGDDRQAYWAANAAIAQMNGDWTTAGVSGGANSPADLDWTACSKAMQTIEGTDYQADQALAGAVKSLPTFPAPMTPPTAPTGTTSPTPTAPPPSGGTPH